MDSLRRRLLAVAQIPAAVHAAAQIPEAAVNLVAAQIPEAEAAARLAVEIHGAAAVPILVAASPVDSHAVALILAAEADPTLAAEARPAVEIPEADQTLAVATLAAEAGQIRAADRLVAVKTK